MAASMTSSLPSRLVIAIGGNAIHPEEIRGTADEQKHIAAATAHALLPLALTQGNELVLVHGNGPVVGKILMRSALTRDRLPPMPLDICVAHSQGGIAYLLMQAIENALRERGNERDCTCLLTQVEVEPGDPAFQNPTKYVGPFFSESEARAIGAELGWRMKEDGKRGWRHVVPSPRPKHICDISLVKVLAARGTIVISGGGGGIPVVRKANGVREGIEAVIDKDMTSALMANVLGYETLIILTAVSKVAVDFGKPTQRWLDRVTMQELKAHHAAGQFPPGSMGPKIDAAIDFLERGGKRVIIARLDEAMPALEGKTGTHVVAEKE